MNVTASAARHWTSDLNRSSDGSGRKLARSHPSPIIGSNARIRSNASGTRHSAGGRGRYTRSRVRQHQQPQAGPQQLRRVRQRRVIGGGEGVGFDLAASKDLPPQLWPSLQPVRQLGRPLPVGQPASQSLRFALGLGVFRRHGRQ